MYVPFKKIKLRLNAAQEAIRYYVIFYIISHWPKIKCGLDASSYTRGIQSSNEI